MNCMFESCEGAISHACRDRSFGIYYSELRNANPNIHIHDCCEVFFCLSGGKNFLIGDRLYDVRDRDVFVINQYEAHKITYDDVHEFRRYVFQISPEFIHAVSSSQTDLSACFYPHAPDFDHRVQLDEEDAARLLDRLARLARPENYGDDILKRNLMTDILVALNRAYLQQDTVKVPHRPNAAVKAAIDYINGHFREDLTLDTVAKATCLSVNQLCRLFSKHCGTTIAKYITSRRLTEAKRMLSAGKSVTETAMLCGFGDYSVFIRAFKRNVGVTPGSLIPTKKEKT